MTESPTKTFQTARDLLFSYGTDYDKAKQAFSWPHFEEFNWALDWFDVIAKDNDKPGLWIVEEDGSEKIRTFAQLTLRSNQVANWFREHGMNRGDRVLVMLGNQIELWETMLAIMKLGAVIIPASTLLQTDDLVDRIERGQVRHVVTRGDDTEKFATVPGNFTRIAVGPATETWLNYRDNKNAETGFDPEGTTKSSDTLMLYFTSGTTGKPKLVEHTHVSYPVGHLSTMYWIGLHPGDIHCNISSPGWAKHAWSSIFAPWNAEATILVYNYERFSAAALLDVLSRTKVSTFCAPPTVWRMLIQEDLATWQVTIREAVSAGEPLNPEVIDQVQRSWHITVRDGYGQTETTAQIGNTPGQPLKPGSMGRPLPGYLVELVDPVTDELSDEGEICLHLDERPLGLMTGYRDNSSLEPGTASSGFYHTGDVAARDSDGYLTYIGRADDVFKASDYRISPFELESVLIEHPAVAEAAVVPSPDPVRGAVPKAYIGLAIGQQPDRETAFSILQYARTHLAPFKRIRRIEFAELPKTISGKIRRVDLRAQENERHQGSPLSTGRSPDEYWEDDFPDLRT
ncbi:MAG: AMP-dependent synthetase [Actinomycetota bacterium]|nr:MAG: AMP-dependent synthetase [Actinomycetota bacterium]